MTLPDQYEWLYPLPGPVLLKTALTYYGLKEGSGSADNPIIMKWAHDFGITWYIHDSIAWCSLYLGEMAHEAGYIPPDRNNLLAAISWAKWGIGMPSPFLGCIMVFNRPDGHHVGLYIGEDDTAYHILGGNTGDAVAIARIGKERLVAIRWPKNVDLPEDRNKILLSSTGVLSKNES